MRLLINTAVQFPMRFIRIVPVFVYVDPLYRPDAGGGTPKAWHSMEKLSICWICAPANV